MTLLLAFSELAPLDWGILAIAILAVSFGCYTLGRSRSGVPETVRAAELPATPSAPTAEADVLTFLALLQEKGRLVDFLMDDVTSYSDAQVGAAARVVHQGCQAVLQEHLQIAPIAEDSEGAPVSLEIGYNASDYRLLGQVSGDPPFKGKLVHKGWRATSVKLPRTTTKAGEQPNIAPAQVEIS